MMYLVIVTASTAVFLLSFVVSESFLCFVWLKELMGEFKTDRVYVRANVEEPFRMCLQKLRVKFRCVAYLVGFIGFYPRDAMLARVIAIATCPSVRPSVRPSRAGIVSKRRKLAA